jgi:hypothetical protein
LEPDARAVLTRSVRSLVVVESARAQGSPEVARAH